MPTEFRECRRNILRKQDSLRRGLDRQYLSTELMIRESVLTEILEHVCAQLFRLKQRKDELTPEPPGTNSAEVPRDHDMSGLERSAEPIVR